MELLIVIGIMAVLATAATIVLNPAQLLAQARDSQRISDMDALKAALSLYLSDVSVPYLIETGQGLNCPTYQYTNVPAGASTSSFSVARSNPANAASSTARSVGGSGWLPVNFSAISGGSPLAVLPIDPTGSGNNIYRYACDQTAKSFELNACLESSKYMVKMGEDGGDKPASGAVTAGCGNIATTGFYEVGTVLNL